MAANVNDVAAYLLERHGPMSTMKLHKLLYYCQAWHLVWTGKPLFEATIEAWRDGPVVPDVFALHEGRFMIDSIPVTTDPADIEPSERESIDIVFATYGPQSASDLSARTHAEAPWVNARAGVASHLRGAKVITHHAMFEYFDEQYQATG
ncbi:MAG: DUF4065 domain-containing protein [Chloroflexi bacterium]|nr:DUF4065 domain-containing protein [Chloroflexota bacterium]